MSTVAEIVEAVRQLSPAEKQQLLEELKSVFSGSTTGESSDYLSAQFTRRLVEHFHRARRQAEHPKASERLGRKLL